MEDSTTIEKLIEKSEIYARTSLELCKYEAVYKSADLFSNLAIKMAVTIVVVLSLLFINVGLALWIGQQMNNIYCGFFIIAFVYLFLAILLYVFRKNWIKIPVSNFIINKMINENEL